MVNNRKYENLPLSLFTDPEIELLDHIVDEDIIFRRDLLEETGILRPDREVINFTFDEFRDYLIADYLINTIYRDKSEIAISLFYEMLVPSSPVAEGTSKYLFCIAKRKKDDSLIELLKLMPWYKDVFLDGIFAIRDELVTQSDIEEIYAFFKNSFSDRAYITTNLIFRYDCKAYRNLNIDNLFEFFVSFDHNEFQKYIAPIFTNENTFRYSGALRHPNTWKLEDFLGQLSQILENESLDLNPQYFKLFELLLYLMLINDYLSRYLINEVYSKFAAKYWKIAESQLIKARTSKCEGLAKIASQLYGEYQLTRVEGEQDVAH